MTKSIGIRYKTPQGKEGVWTPLTSSEGLRGRELSDETLKAFLAHWHPEYVYLGRVRATDVGDDE